MRKRCAFMLRAFLSLTAVIPSSLLGQPSPLKDFRFELSTGLSREFLPLRTSYLHQYSPPFLSGDYVSRAEQNLRIEGRESWGGNAAFTYYPGKRLGLQVQIEYARPRLRGKNSSYEVRVNYALSSSAGSPPYPYLFERTYGWPSTEGNVDEICFSLNAAVRLPVSERLALNLSGGPTYFRVRSELVGPAYSRYWMEDGYFMGETFQLKYRLGWFGKLGWNLGGELGWRVLGTVAVTLDFRYYSASESTPSIQLLANEMLDQPLSETAAAMELGAIAFDPTFYRINLGLKYLF